MQAQIEMNANIQFTDGMTTKEIQEILIKSANDSLEFSTIQYAVGTFIIVRNI